MAGYSEKDIDSSEDFSWTPPTEAEMKVIQARRDRSDRISKIMGSYLLKGYKMLASECSCCGTIELEDKRNKIYCVACEEIDPDIQKDNPALNEKAASSQRAEHQFVTERTPTDHSLKTSTPQSAVSVANLQQSLAQAITTTTVTSSTTIKPSSTRSTPVDEEFTKCLDVAQKKLAWARSALEVEVDPNVVTSYLKVITACAEAIVTLKKIAA